MHYFYVLKSLKNTSLYYGYSANLQERIREHNAGKATPTKTLVPLELVYYEAYKSEKDARRREISIKKRESDYTSLRRRITESLKK